MRGAVVPILRALLVTAALAAAMAITTSQASAASRLLSANGRIGDVYVDRASATDVQGVYGQPSSKRSATGSRGGRPIPITEWRYACKAGSSSFFFDGGGVLRNFFSSCRQWRTPADSRVGDRHRPGAASVQRSLMAVM
jgi:hypothetical protein